MLTYYLLLEYALRRNKYCWPSFDFQVMPGTPQEAKGYCSDNPKCAMFFVSNQFLSGLDEKRWCLHSATIANSPLGSETYVKRGKYLSFQVYFEAKICY